MKHFLLTTVSALSFLSLNSSCSSDIDDQQEIYNMPSCQKNSIMKTLLKMASLFQTR